MTKQSPASTTKKIKDRVGKIYISPYNKHLVLVIKNLTAQERYARAGYNDPGYLTYNIITGVIDSYDAEFFSQLNEI